tara:strand:+ start:1046 stop:1342 length:297 start_codon:yes stop_codon:yes gene_type:complete
MADVRKNLLPDFDVAAIDEPVSDIDALLAQLDDMHIDPREYPETTQLIEIQREIFQEQKMLRGRFPNPINAHAILLNCKTILQMIISQRAAGGASIKF